MLSRLLALHASDEVVMAQFDAYRRRVPILYAVLILNTVAMAITHHAMVSPILTIYAPLLFCGFMAIRTVYWLRLRHYDLDAAQARDQLTKTTVLAVVLSLMIPIWALLLYHETYNYTALFGGITQRGHAVLYIGLTAVSCTALLVHSRLAATLVGTIVNGPFCIYLLMHGSVVEVAVALNLILITLAMFYVLFAFSRDFEDLVESRHAFQSLSDQQAHFANTDAITDLASRRNFLACFDEVLHTGQAFALLLIDLDGFKQVNDLYGHKVGDQVLAEIGQRLQQGLHGQHCLARIGGDEFAVLHPVSDPQRVIDLGEALVQACSHPITVMGGLVIKIGASIGISLAKKGQLAHEDHSDLLEQADYALSHVKQHGKGRVQVFEPAHERAVRRLGEVELALRKADFAAEISLVFQPVVVSGSGRLIGFEVLARWQNPGLGAVSPIEFVPAAERAGIIGSLTQVVLEKGLQQALTWPDHVRLKINLSAHDVSSPVQMLRIVTVVQQSGVSPTRLTFELTETAFNSDLKTVEASVAMIKAMGSSLAIDDFGTGYSSLSYVHRFDPDVIKIDRSFVARLRDGDGSQAIIKTIIEMCRNFGARSLAEGVETEEQARLLTAMGIDEIQGYLYGRPMPGEAIAAAFFGELRQESA